jgi:hypothetical protein
MACRDIVVAGRVIGIACDRTRAKPCVECGRASNRLCDAELQGKKQGKTCDRAICTTCAVHVVPDKDLCHAHARVAGKL